MKYYIFWYEPENYCNGDAVAETLHEAHAIINAHPTWNYRVIQGVEMKVDVVKVVDQLKLERP